MTATTVPPPTAAAVTMPPTTTTTVTVPPTTTPTIDQVCQQTSAIDGCPLGSPAAIAWAQQQEQAAQAAVTQQAVEAYEQCLANNAQAISAQILQTFGRVSDTGSPTWESCSTVGLTPDQVQQAQEAEGGPP
jgi:hypothetical protein